MKRDLAVDPLERSCTEWLFQDPTASDGETLRFKTVAVRELALVPVFVLLGEPGMGKSMTMQALAAHAHGKFTTVNDFIVGNAVVREGSKTVFIDALDEARASGDTTVWKELRQGIARSSLERFGVACRAADWNATDREDLMSVVNGLGVRVFSLEPLTVEQRRRVLEHQGIDDVDAFEQKAQDLGFGDMLGNPQSLELLVAAIRNRNQQWPDNRREAYELACKELVREVNSRHQQAQSRSVSISHEALLDAAGWVCALMLLSNSSEVFEDGNAVSIGTHVVLPDVLHALPADGPSRVDVQQVLQRRLFIKRSGYMPVHRTVAEYLAARHIGRRVDAGVLLPTRVASLMFATPRHLVNNLRGLAGWLAALCEPMRSAIFDADPVAVLNYGDLHLLPAATKQLLIDRLSTSPNVQYERHHWQRAASHVPLVQEDMRSFVQAWLAVFLDEAAPPPSRVFVAHVLLSAIANAPRDAEWEPTLLCLIRNDHSTEDIRDSALHALFQQHTSPETLLGLLNELTDKRLPDVRGRLSDHLLQVLYPDHLPPSQVLRYLTPIKRHGRSFPEFGMFWTYHIQRKTPKSLLMEMMQALVTADEGGVLKGDALVAGNHGLEGLGSIAVTAVETFGASLPTPELARWLQLCSRGEASLFSSLNLDSAQGLTKWIHAHGESVQAVLKLWMHQGANSWEAQNRLQASWMLPHMGMFWLDQVKESQARDEVKQAQECLATAISWLQRPDGGITLDDVCAVVQGHEALEAALKSHLVSPLDDSNWQRTHWLDGQKYREQSAARDELNARNREYLLNHLDDVRSGKLLSYLNESACTDLDDSGYSGGINTAVIKQWREEHPELDEATRQGYLALLEQLNGQQAEDAVASHKKNRTWHFELPCLVAADQLFSQSSAQFFELGKERLQALLTLYLLHHINKTDWLLALIDEQVEWVEEVWGAQGAQALRARAQVRIPLLWVLAREPRARALAVRLLPRFLKAWPVKFAEESFAEFAQLLEAVLRICPQEISELVTQRLRKKSLSSLQKAYLVMAGLWVDPRFFAPLISNLIGQQQLVHAELLGFVGYMNRYGGKAEELPRWEASTMGMLFRLFGPLCRPAFPQGGVWAGSKEAGREFLHQLLGALRVDASVSAKQELQQLQSDPALGEWRVYIESVQVRQSQFRAEQSFARPTALQVAQTLQSKTPANPSDLMAVGLDALNMLQKEIRNSPTNLINQFWTVDSAGKRPLPPHLPEPQCRNVIAGWLKPRLKSMGVSVDPEHQHGGQNQSDIVLRVQAAGHEDMLLPIEVKGDWSADLWTAPHQQLAIRYASDPACHGRGIYLVLWLGAQRGEARSPKQHPNRPAQTPAGFQALLQHEIEQKAPGLNIQVVILDVAIDQRGG